METKISLDVVKEKCETIGELLGINGKIKEFNRGGEIFVVIQGKVKGGISESGFYAEKLIKEVCK